MRYSFPQNFVWGAATSAYQIEGSPLADGAGMSIQHTYSHMPGATADGMTGDLLADHYNRWPEDVALMKEMGLGAYQFSVAWPRVLPEGVGAVNRKGLDFYDRLFDALLESGVMPAPILHVWDFPTVLQNRGGWANRDSAEWFAEYAAVVFDRLGDRAAQWMTICEPLSIALGGYIGGLLPPRIMDLYAGMRAGHHVLLAHGRAVQAFRASAAKGEIGTSTGLTDIQPASDLDEDLAAAERVRGGHNAIYLDPILLGAYPVDAPGWYGDAWPEVRDGDLKVISSAVDFVGVTYYRSMDVAHGEAPVELRDPKDRWADADEESYDPILDTHVVPRPGQAKTDIGWPIDADGLVRSLRWLRARYGDVPVVISETGGAFDDVVKDGSVHDPKRRAFLRDHMIATHRAITEHGIDVRGFYVWSFIDTWEFWLGCTARFGLVHIDFDTRRRTVKDSGRWYRDVINANGLE